MQLYQYLLRVATRQRYLSYCNMYKYVYQHLQNVCINNLIELHTLFIKSCVNVIRSIKAVVEYFKNKLSLNIINGHWI